MRSDRAKTQVIFVVSTLVALGIVAALVLLADRAGTDPADGDVLGEVTAPDIMDQSTPQASVMTYLVWVSYSYRIADSSVAEAAMTTWEHVRIDSYIEYNRQQGRALDQHLALFEPSQLSVDATTAVLPAYEEWQYRYVDIASGEYLTDVLHASYDTTYTLVFEDGRWLVDRVEAAPIGEVQ